MNYPTPSYGVPVAAKSSSTKIILIVVCVVIGIVLILGAIGIALGVGLGVGLSRRNSDSSSSTGVLTAPTVNCVFSSGSGCGCAATKPSFQSSARIYQGYTAVANSWPWVVALYFNNNQSFCTGFLVSYQHVVTAAHCLDGIIADTITAYAGIQKRSEASSGQYRVVSDININPGYSAGSFVNDIAVLKLATEFNSSTTVATCCVTSDTSLPNIDENGVIIGWGQTSSSIDLSDDLLQAVIRVSSVSLCGVSGTDNGRFCAGYAQTSPCNGDSGAPFMTSVNNLWTCTGLVSNSIQCGGSTLFTRISTYKSFIDGITSG